MSDYNNPNSYDKYGNPIPPTARYAYEPVGTNTRAPYVLLGLLALVGIVGGAMYFNGGHRTASDVAVAPPRVIDTRPAPAPMTDPTITTPAPTPAPAPSTTQQ